jgi:hypothetical protein
MTLGTKYKTDKRALAPRMINPKAPITSVTIAVRRKFAKSPSPAQPQIAAILRYYALFCDRLKQDNPENWSPDDSSSQRLTPI